MKEQLEHHFVVQMTASFHLFGDADRPYATYLLSSIWPLLILTYEETLVQDSKCPAGSAGAVCKAGGPSGPAAVYQQGTLSKGLVSTRVVHHFVLERLASCAPARTEPASAPVTRALAGSWLLISMCETQSLPSLHPSSCT